MDIKTIKVIAPRIAFVVVELEDGRWTRFSADDIQAVREFALVNTFTEYSDPRLWKLLEFIASQAPPPLPETDRGLQIDPA